MPKYLKLFETESEFKSCLYDNINSVNANKTMGFPNVSIIADLDNNGNYDVDKIYYISGTSEAQNIYSDLDSSSNSYGLGSYGGYEYYSGYVYGN